MNGLLICVASTRRWSRHWSGVDAVGNHVLPGSSEKYRMIAQAGVPPSGEVFVDLAGLSASRGRAAVPGALKSLPP